MKRILTNLKNWLIKLSLFKKILVVVLLIIAVWFGYSKLFVSKQNQTQYQTAIAEKGTLVVAITGSGSVTTANNSTVETKATGVVSKLYVKDGDQVKSGDKIADIDLDLAGQQNSAQALASYQQAKTNLDSAQANLYSLQSTMFTNWKKYLDLATNSTYQNSDGSPNNTNRALAEFHVSQDDWLAAEAKYKNQQAVINQAQTAVNSSWLNYRQNSPTIYAPISGTVTGLSLGVGSIISATTNSSNTQVNTKIASITTNAPPIITVNLTEIDIPQVKIGNKATLTLDAFPGKTYTGKVVSIDTSGTVNSGVTSYPTYIQLDTNNQSILPNMSVSASIITNIKRNVLIVPSSSIQTLNDETYVRVLKNNQMIQKVVTTGLASDSQIEITSGLNEGETVVTSITQTQSKTTTSPFSSGFGGGIRTTGGSNVIRSR